MKCTSLDTDLTTTEAHHVLEPFYLVTREKFLDAGFDKLKHTRFEIADGFHDTPRHFAACSEDGRLIVSAPEMSELHVELVVGILAHELGHAVDFSYPGEWVLGDEGVTRRTRDETTDNQWVRWMRSWENRDGDVVEQTADRIAGMVMGIPIGYVGPCNLQCIGHGVPRPEGLR